ncbi:MAG: hypothetical protein K5905_28060 [Roseibium sp.]|nr:hypothetical protein [Roseibium sp.]
MFFLLLLSLFEIGLLFVRMAMLDFAVTRVSKSIYIGSVSSEVAKGEYTQADIKADVCKLMGALVPECNREITVELREISSIARLPNTNAKCRDSQTNVNPSVTFNPGGSRSVVFMRVCVTVDLLTPGLGFGLALPKTDTNRHEVISAAAFMNEPF